MMVARLRSDERPGLTHELVVLGGWVERLRGLLGTGPDASPVLLARCGSIHTFGMRYAIDVAFLGERGEVLDVVRAVEPGRFCSCLGAECVVERPSSGEAWLEVGEHLWIVSVSVGAAGDLR